MIVPGDGEYDSARRLASFNPTTDKHPQMIVRCATTEDVCRAVVFAREHGVEVAVRSGGHDVLGASVCDGLVIDLAGMNAIRADPERRTVRVEPGVRSGQLSAALQGHGLAAALGCHPGVGVAGLTVGGGLGWLLGKHGAACDHLVGADLVTAEGKKLRVSKTENAELFWALRGGGGNFGIVTSLDFRLHPVNRVFGGVLVLRTDVRRFLRFYRTFMEGAPDELTVEISIIAGEQPVIVAIVCWSGDAAQGSRVLQPLRSFDSPVADWIDDVAYAHLTDRVAEVGSLLSRAQPQQQRGPGYGYWRGGSLRELSGAAADQIAAAIEHAPGGSSLGLGHFMHGQVCRVEPGATPLIRTAGQITYFFNTGWGDPRLADDRMEWVNRCCNAMKPFSSRGAYINYLSADDPAAVEASYGKNYERLAQIKTRYDPSNFFHRNRNIRPRAM
ncbi:MAG TPA: FAD-binding oxidoreductase [Bryobacteraceae bacterium]|nr:FAD-binding oxidoreductase [Bryobacteraceae bacterium]